MTIPHGEKYDFGCDCDVCVFNNGDHYPKFCSICESVFPIGCGCLCRECYCPNYICSCNRCILCSKIKNDCNCCIVCGNVNNKIVKSSEQVGR